jgi:hypothetical protein
MAVTLTNTGILFPDGTSLTSSDTLPNIQTFTSSGTWTSPAGVTKVILTMIGGGGNGGVGGTFQNGTTTYTQGGGGGGSGAVVVSYKVNVVPSTQYTVTVGASAAASSFGSLLTVNPGITSSAFGFNAIGGLGGTAPASTIGPGLISSYSGVAGLAGGYQQYTGGNNTFTAGGQGGATPYFNILGGAGGAFNGGGTAGPANTGAGGGGRGYNATAAVGAGGTGIVIVQW